MRTPLDIYGGRASSIVGGRCHGMSMHIDCNTCQVRGPACEDCMVTVLLGPPPEFGFEDDDSRALGVLAAAGLIPPLRMVHPMIGPEVESA